MARRSATQLLSLLLAALALVASWTAKNAFAGLHATRGARKGVPMRYTVTLDTPDGQKSFECAPDEYILDKAEELGLDVPYACRAGTCASCAGKVLEGTVDQSEQIFLDESQVDKGYCTTCVSKPTSDVRIQTHVEREIYEALNSKTATVSHPRETLEEHSGSSASTGIRFRQNFAELSEHLLNEQVQRELYASHVYQAMGSYFDRADVALPGFKDWSMKNSAEEREHAEKFMEYINLRGGRYTPAGIMQPEAFEFSSALDAMEYALKLEINVNKHLLNLHHAADKADDAQMCDFLEANYLTEQVESINDVAKVVRKLTRVGPGLGEYTVDKDMA